jgi:hypothetical protein
MPGNVVIIFEAPASRRVLAESVRRAGFDVHAVGDARAAVALLAGPRRVLPVAIGVESSVLRDEADLWTAAICDDTTLERVPVVVRMRDRDADVLALFEEYAVVHATAGLAQFASTIIRAAHASGMPRVARGTPRLGTAIAADGLHEYAESKLAVFLGAERAAAVLEQVAAHLPGCRIATTADLRDVAGRLRDLGGIAASIATLLSGRATLLDSEATLRSR